MVGCGGLPHVEEIPRSHPCDALQAIVFLSVRPGAIFAIQYLLSLHVQTAEMSALCSEMRDLKESAQIGPNETYI